MERLFYLLRESLAQKLKIIIINHTYLNPCFPKHELLSEL